MKVKIDAGEWYPVYSFYDNTEEWWGDVVDVDPQTLYEWSEVFESFERVQIELREALRKARKPRDEGEPGV